MMYLEKRANLANVLHSIIKEHSIGRLIISFRFRIGFSLNVDNALKLSDGRHFQHLKKFFETSFSLICIKLIQLF